MQVDINTVAVVPGTSGRPQVQITAKAFSTSSEAKVPGDGKSPSALNRPSLQMRNTSSAGSVKEVQPFTAIDWSDLKTHERFAALERKLGRKEGTAEEREKYLRMRESKRAWIKGRTYMADYVEEERQKALAIKLRELRELLRPVKM